MSVKYSTLRATNPVTTPLSGNEIWAVVQDGESRGVIASEVAAFLGSGTVTSVSGLSPLFTVSNPNTTPTFALVNQNANLVYAGPTNGAAAAPAFRALVIADIPDLSSLYEPLGGGSQDLQSVLSQGSSASIATEIDVTVTGASNVGFFRLHPTQGHEWSYEDTGTSLATTMALTTAGWSVTNNLSGVGITLSTTGVAIGNGPLTLAGLPTSALHAATKSYVDSVVVGLWDDRGNFDASGGAYPTSAAGGSGAAGAVLKGDIWTISVAGTLPTGQVVEVGDTVRALVDTPGNTQANWAIAQNNIGYVPLTSTLANTNFFVGNASNVATAVAMSGQATIDNTGAVTLSNAAVIAKVLTGYVSGSGTVAATDTILQAIQKLNGNDALKWSLASGGALTANNTLTGAFSVTFNLTSTTSPFNVTGSYTVPGGGAVSSYLATFGGTITGKGTSNDGITGVLMNPTLTNSTGTAVFQICLRLAPTFSGSVVSGPNQTVLQIVGGSSTALTQLISANNSAGQSRWLLRGDGTQVWATTLAGSDFGGTISSPATNTGHLLYSLSIGGSSTVNLTTYFQRYTGGLTTGSTGSINHSIWDNRSHTINHINCVISGYLYDPAIAGTQAGTETNYAFRAASGLSSFGTASAANAWVTLGAGTTAIGPLKFTSGTNLTTAVAGVMEYNGTNLFFTRSGTTREGVLTQSAVTTEVIVSDTSVTVNIGGVTYKLLARA